MKASKPYFSHDIATKSDEKIILVLLDAVKKLPDIIHLVESKGSKIADISIRQNTLEDVFIELTGRQLRE